MTAADEAIVSLFEDQGWSPDAIAVDQDVEVESVKICLSQHSSLYRSLTEKPLDEKTTSPELLALKEQSTFRDGEKKEAAQIVADLARCSDNDSVRLRAAKLILEHDTKHNGKNIKNLNIGVIMFNDQLKRAREAKERARQKTIEIRPEDAVLINALTEKND